MKEIMGKNSFILYSSYEQPISQLTDEEAGQLFKGIFEYIKTGEAELSGAAKMAFLFIKNDIDVNAQKYAEIIEKRREAGKCGGRPKKQMKANAFSEKQMKANAFSEKQMKANAFSEKQTKAKKAVDDDVDDDVDVDDGELPPSAPPRHKYGEYNNVLLNDTELETLKKELPYSWEEYIERVSAYVASSGKHYKSYLATIRNWARKDGEKNNNVTGDDYDVDYSVLERIVRSKGG